MKKQAENRRAGWHPLYQKGLCFHQSTIHHHTGKL